MSAERYFEEVGKLLNTIRTTQRESVLRASKMMAESIASGHVVHLFGSGHSVLPVMDCFPRYGSYLGFNPLIDPRLSWFNVVGPGGARELLWLERREGYIENFLKSYTFSAGDTLIAYSHGGLNAAAIEVAMAARRAGVHVIAVTSLANYRTHEATHSSGKKLADLADIAIDNCVPPEDALVPIEGVKGNVAAGSTVAVSIITMALVAETASELSRKGIKVEPFVSPNVPDVAPDHNEQVFERFSQLTKNSRK